jgi:diguanylate cyclase (GGDEF)-like protein
MLVLWGEDLKSEDIPAANLFASQVAVSLQNAHLYSEVQQLSVTDELTRLYNRRGLYSLGRREAERALRFNRPLTALMIDIDDFKKFNDQYSYRTGDEILVGVAQRMMDNLREVDLMGRFGGDEFIILLVETTLSASQRIMDRLLEAICGRPFSTRYGLLPVSISAGLAEFTGDFELLIDDVGAAVHRAKLRRLKH